jgi:hypothetical protein
MESAPPIDSGCYTEHGVSGYGLAVKLTLPDLREDEFIKSMAEEMMLRIAELCMERGAKCIGHIKSHIRTDAGTLKADTIGVTHGAFSHGSLDKPVKDLFMAVNSIVQGIHQDEVRIATLDGIHAVAESKGILVEKEKEHTYFDEFDFTTSKEEYRRILEEQLREMEESKTATED